MGATILQRIRRHHSTRIPRVHRSYVAPEPQSTPFPTTQAHLVKERCPKKNVRSSYTSFKLHRVGTLVPITVRREKECHTRDNGEAIYRQVHPTWQQRPLRTLYGESLDFYRRHEFSAC